MLFLSDFSPIMGVQFRQQISAVTKDDIRRDHRVSARPAPPFLGASSVLTCGITLAIIGFERLATYPEDGEE
jgi:hypothetical protein